MALDRQVARRLALANGAARCALGVAAFAAPALPLAPWVGDARTTPAARLLARALGARDVALGAGVLIAVRRNAPVRGWLEASALADAADALITLGAFASLPRGGRWAVLGAATAGVAAAVVAAPAVDDLDQQEGGSPERPPSGAAPDVMPR